MMELIAIIPLAVVIVLSYRLWFWWKTNGSGPVLDKFFYQLRLKFGVVSIHELEVVQEHLVYLEHQVHARLAFLENRRQLRDNPRSLDVLNGHSQEDQNSPSVKEGSFLRPRSIVWNGLRFTLSDSVWSYIEEIPREDLVDSQVQVMVQGPFCRHCLKRLIRKNRVHAAEVPAQCHYCGLTWNTAESEKLPVSLVDLKRRLMTALSANRG
jgi:hypothetical protein